MNATYPDFVLSLPEADVPVPGVWSRLLQADGKQVAFFRLPQGLVIPPHSHGAQWGFVLSGSIELTISGETRAYGPGDAYFIPAGAVHGVFCPVEAQAVDFFADPDRYRPKAR